MPTRLGLPLRQVRFGFHLEFKLFLHLLLFLVGPMLTDTLANGVKQGGVCELNVILEAESLLSVNRVK